VKKKSLAQLRRNADRAVARGETISEELAGAITAATAAAAAAGIEGATAAAAATATADAPVVVAAGGESVPEAESAESAAAVPELNARERRLARREAERNGEAVEEALLPKPTRNQDAAAAAAAEAAAASAFSEGAGGGGGGGLIPNVVFVGQLPFSATEVQVRQHFEAGAEIPKGNLKVRMLSNAQTGKSRGMAFVEVANAEEQHRALGLHRSYFGSGEGNRRRQINVEKSSGGGRDSKRKRIEEGRQGQESYMKETVCRIIDDYVANGKLSKEVIEEDRHLKEMLHRCDAATVDSALEEFTERDLSELSNPAAYLTALVCRKLAEGFDAKLVASKKNDSSSSSAKKTHAPKYGEAEGGGGGGGGYGSQAAPLEKRFPSMSTRGRGRGR
jgi:nucleolin